MGILGSLERPCVAIGLPHKEGRENMAWLPENPNEARHVVFETMIVLRQQLNKALGCHIKTGDLEFLTRAVMDKMYRRGKPRKKKK